MDELAGQFLGGGAPFVEPVCRYEGKWGVIAVGVVCFLWYLWANEC
jgi:hypothetical protein